MLKPGNPNNPSKIYKFGIIGFGIAGQLLILELLKNNIPSKDIFICDETFLGGALATHYGSVLSNTTWAVIRSVFEAYPLWNTDALQYGDTTYQPDMCMPVREIVRMCLMIVNNASSSVKKQTTRVLKIEPYTDKIWTIEHTFGKLQCSVLFLTQGGSPKVLDISHSTIPLSIALDKEQLKQHINSDKDDVTVFGTSHSSVIILKHLHDLGVSTNSAR
jgi:hypothetical protein